MRADGELLTCEPADGAAHGAALFPVLMTMRRRAIATVRRAARPAGRASGRPARPTPSRSLFDDRYRRRLRMLGDGGLDFLLDLVEPIVLHDGDGLRLERAASSRSKAAEEDLVEVRGRDAGRVRAARLASRQPPSAGADRGRPHPDPRRSRHRRHAEGPGRRGAQGARAVRSRRRRLRPAQSRSRPRHAAARSPWQPICRTAASDAPSS